MPTIEFSLKELNSLVRKDIALEDMHLVAEFAKAEFDGYDEASKIIKFDCADTNLPYLWSVEGIARIIRGGLGLETGIPLLHVTKSEELIHVDPQVSKVRPFISGFIARGKSLDEGLLKQIIQLQEKLCESFGRRRRKVAVGVYPGKKIEFPLTYRTTVPDGMRFPPLDMDKGLTPAEILQQHPKGVKYAFTLAGKKEYPILVDNTKKVLSLIPIINSNNLGKLEHGDDEIFFEATGTDESAVSLCCTIFAYMFADRGFEIVQVTTKYQDKTVASPQTDLESIELDFDAVKSTIGIDLSKEEITALLQKARYNVDGNKVTIPPYRQDIMHQVDVIEDVAIMYGYSNIPTSPIETHTVGEVDPLIEFAHQARELMVGLGFTEVLSPMLTNKSLLYDKMNAKDFGTIEIKEYMSETYSVVRSWLLPMLFHVLANNKHNEYPQNIFESGLVTVKKAGKVVDFKRLAAVYCGSHADYTKARQVVDLLLNSFAVDYTIEETDHPSFIPGRVARVFVQGKGIAFVGEFHPQVLENFDLQMPVAGFEMNLSELFELRKKK